MAAEIPPPRHGDTFVLSDRDYLYGTGPIVVRVEKVVRALNYDNEPWWQVEAQAANGTPENHGGWHSRQVYIREAAFPQTRQRSTAQDGV